MDEEKPNYYAIIPAEVRYDKELKDKAKLLYGEISALCNKDGKCWASNNYFASLYGVSNETISRLITDLIDKGYVFREIVYKENSKEIKARYLQINQYLLTKMSIPIDENVKDNNTSINNTSINIKENSNIINNITKRKAKFTPPTLEEVEAYIKEKDLIVDAKQFIDYFEEGNWTDSKGNKVKNWKQKLLTWNKFRTQGRRSKKTPEEFKREQEADREEFFRLLKEKGIE